MTVCNYHYFRSDSRSSGLKWSTLPESKCSHAVTFTVMHTVFVTAASTIIPHGNTGGRKLLDFKYVVRFP